MKHIISLVLRISSFPIPFLLTHLCAFSLSAIVWWNRCPHDLGRAFLRFASVSLDFSHLSFPVSLPFSYLDDTPTLAAPTVLTKGLFQEMHSKFSEDMGFRR